jgi:peroxiredoxin Q/BCP
VSPAFPLSLLLALLLGAPTARSADLDVGSPAPPFSLPGSDGKQHGLTDHAGKRGVVLAWFPKAFTSGCTAEMQDMRDHADAIGAYDAAVYLVSLDPPDKNREFAEAEGAKQVVLSDPDGEVARAYGVLGPAGLYANRWTFYVDAEGKIAAIDKQVSTSTAGQDIARKLGELGFPKKP